MLADATQLKIVRPCGALLLSVHPPSHGGGVKDENLQLAKSRVAALLLDRGLTLPASAQAADELTDKVGSRSVLQAVESHDPAIRWNAVSKLAADNQVLLPHQDQRTAKAAVRLQKAARRKQFARQAPLCTSDFYGVEGSWCGLDEQPVQIHQCLGPDLSGVLMLDATEATPLDLSRLSAMSADALCVVIPGHQCPDPTTCSRKVSVPVRHKLTNHSHLIAACHHNLGATEIKPFFNHSAEVDVSGTLCCTFQMFRDEAPSADAWSQATSYPVRVVADAFKARGIEAPFHHPWGRAFRVGGRPSALRRLRPSPFRPRSSKHSCHGSSKLLVSMGRILSHVAGSTGHCQVGASYG